MKGTVRLSELTPERIRSGIEFARKISAKLRRSHKWVPLKLEGPKDVTGGEYWANPWYDVRVRRYTDGWVMGGGPWVKIGISCSDGQARHDWRVFQLIKNEVTSPEWWALELYPAESQLIDPSNYYILYAAPELPFGERNGRVLAGPANCMAPQRPWHPDDEPQEVRQGIVNWPNKPKR